MGIHAIFPHGKFPRRFPRVCGFRQVLSVGLLSLPCSIGCWRKSTPNETSVSLDAPTTFRTDKKTDSPLTTSLVENFFLAPVAVFWVPRNLPSLSACLMATLKNSEYEKQWALIVFVVWKSHLHRSKRVLVSLVYFSNCTEWSESVFVHLDWCSMLYIASRTNRCFVDIHLPLMHSIHLLRDLMLSAVNSYSSAWEAKSHNTNRPWSSNLIATPAQQREVDVYGIWLYCEYRQ